MCFVSNFWSKCPERYRHIIGSPWCICRNGKLCNFPVNDWFSNSKATPPFSWLREVTPVKAPWQLASEDLHIRLHPSRKTNLVWIRFGNNNNFISVTGSWNQHIPEQKRMKETLSLSLPKVINVKFLLQPQQEYYTTQYGELGCS